MQDRSFWRHFWRHALITLWGLVLGVVFFGGLAMSLIGPPAPAGHALAHRRALLTGRLTGRLTTEATLARAIAQPGLALERRGKPAPHDGTDGTATLALALAPPPAAPPDPPAPGYRQAASAVGLAHPAPIQDRAILAEPAKPAAPSPALAVPPSMVTFRIMAPADAPHLKELTEGLHSRFSQATWRPVSVATAPRNALVRYPPSLGRATARDVGRLLGQLGYKWQLERLPNRSDTAANTMEIWLPDKRHHGHHARTAHHGHHWQDPGLDPAPELDLTPVPDTASTPAEQAVPKRIDDPAAIPVPHGPIPLLIGPDSRSGIATGSPPLMRLGRRE